jgi:hypothetical protein
MRKLNLLFLILFSITNLSAQIKLSGQLVDQQQQPIVGAMAVLLSAQDSSMQAFASSDAEGKFKMKASKGQYLLQLSFMGYQTQMRPIELKADTLLPTISLMEESKMVDEVEVAAERIPIQINGDTIDYDANAFNTRDHDNVEQLLKKMPGIKVERDGTLKAQGETVDKITVDGKEFFGNDPQIAMKNLPADAIDKVQVFDRKSEMTDFTGVDDGQRNKTINLKLKEDKKRGVFGQVEGGYGAPNNRYLGDISLNYFSPSAQINTIGNINNINEQSFDFMDYINLMGGMSALMSGEGNISLEIDDNNPLLPLMMGNDQGIARTIGAGLNGNFQLGKKSELNTHYLHSSLNKTKLNLNESSSFTGLEDFESIRRNEDQLGTFNHNLSTTLRNKFNPQTHLDFKMNFRWNDTESERQTFDSTSSNGLLENSLKQSYNGLQTGYGLGGNLDFKKRFQKKGRSLILNVNGGYSQKDSRSFNQSITNIYNNNGTLTSIDSLNQNLYGPSVQQMGGGEVRYTEPLGKKSFLNFQLVSSFSQEERISNFYDVVNDAEVFNDSLSNIFERDYNIQKAGLNYQYNTKKTNLTLGLFFQHSYLGGLVNNNKIANHYYYPVGKLNYNWRVSKGKRLSVNYRSEVKEPNLQQLQPIINNQNPLNIVLGNPNLAPEYRHNIMAHYNHFNQFNFTSLFVSARFSATQNSIINQQYLDEDFRSISAPINAGLTYSGSFNASYDTPIRKLGVEISLEAGIDLTASQAIINNTENNTLGQNYRGEFSIQNRDTEHFELEFGIEMEWTRNSYSTNALADRSFLNYFLFNDLEIYLGEKMDIISEFELGIYSDPNFNQNIYLPLWNMELSRFFLKGNRLKVGIRLHNLLNQDQQINRYTYDYSIGQNQFNTLGRYFMLTLGYKMNKVGADEEPNLMIKMD